MTIENYILKHYGMKKDDYVVMYDDGKHVRVIYPEKDGSLWGMGFKAHGTSFRFAGDYEPTEDEKEAAMKALRAPDTEESKEAVKDEEKKTVSLRVGDRVEVEGVFLERRCGYPVLVAGNKEFVVGFWAVIDFKQGDTVTLSGDITRKVKVRGKKLPLMKNFTRIA